MPGHQLELTIAYPSRPPQEPADYWRWVILDGLRRTLIELDFRDDGVRCGGGFGDSFYVGYRDRFTSFDERSHLIHGTDEGQTRRIPIPYGAYAVCQVSRDLRSAQITIVDDDRLATGTTHRGVRALARAFLFQLEHYEGLSESEKVGGQGLEWLPVRSRSTLSETWLPGRDLLMITDEGDAFLKESSCAGFAHAARAIADDLELDDERRDGLRSLAEAVGDAQDATGTPPPAIAVRADEITAAELLIEQTRLRSRLPQRVVERCVECGARSLAETGNTQQKGGKVPWSRAPTVSPIVILPSTMGMGQDVNGVGPAADDLDAFSCRRCQGRASTRESATLCPACTSLLPEGLIGQCPGCRVELVDTDHSHPYYWFAAPTWTDRDVRVFQAGADPREALRR